MQQQARRYCEGKQEEVIGSMRVCVRERGGGGDLQHEEGSLHLGEHLNTDHRTQLQGDLSQRAAA